MTPTPENAPPGQWSADGWYRPATRVNSPNFGPRPDGALIDLAVIHSISLPPGVYGGPEVFALFTNALDWNAHPYFKGIEGMQVSAHFFIRRDGTLWQFVSCDNRAWHAGKSCYRGRDNCNDDSIGIELEGLEGESFEALQYHSLLQLLTDIRQRYPLRYIAGHEHIAPGRKSDPGDKFEWVRLQQCVALESQCFPDSVLGK